MIRPAQEEDIVALKKAFDAVVGPLDVYSAHARESEMRRYSEEYLRHLLEDDPLNILLAVQEDRVVGFCITRDDDDVLWLSWYGVLPSSRRSGVGKDLLTAMLRNATDRGYWKVWCDSRSDNASSVRLLKDVGFEVICHLKRHWYGQDFVLMQRFLEDEA